MPNKENWFDTETTGLDPEKNDIVQIAGIIIVDGEEVETYNLRCSPFNPDNIQQRALDVIGFTKEEVMSWQPPKEMYNQLMAIYSKHVDKYKKEDKFTPCGQNIPFDLRMLRSFFLKCDDKYFGSFFSQDKIDTLDLIKYCVRFNLVPQLENNKLETMCKHFDIEINAHDALSDIQATRELGEILLGKLDPKKKGA